MLNIIIGKPGSGKTSLIFSEITASYKENSAILLVPDQFSFECERTLLKLCGATNSDKYEVLSFSRLANTVFRQYGGVSAQIISETGRIGRMFLAINQVKNELNLYKKQNSNINFVIKMLELVTEFKRNDCNLDEIVFKSTHEHRLQLKMDDILIIMKAYNALSDDESVDPEDELDMLHEILCKNNFFANKNVFIDSFNDFTAKQIKIVEQIIKNANNVYFSITEESINFKKDSAFALTNNSIKRVINIAQKNNIQVSAPIILNDILRYNNEELKFIANSMHAQNNTDVFCGHINNVSVSVCKNIYDEIDNLAKSIIKLTHINSYKYSEISVVSYNISEYKSIIKSVFSKYYIPFFIDLFDTFDSTFLYSIVKNLIEISLYGYKTEKIMYMLKSVKLYYSQPFQYEFEEFINYWNIDSNLWLTSFESGYYLKNTPSDKLHEFEAVRKYIVNTVDKFIYNFNSGNIEEKCDALFSAIKSLETIKIFEKRAKEYLHNNDLVESSLLVSQYNTLINILTQLSISLSKMDVDNLVFYNIFQVCSAGTQMEVAPNRPDEVKIGNARLIRPSNPKVMFVIGCNEGVYPNTANAVNDLLSTQERKLLIKNNINISDKQEHKRLIDNYIVYSTFCYASERLFVSYNRFDTSQNELSRCLAVKNLLNKFENLHEEFVKNNNIYIKQDLYENLALNYNNNDTNNLTYKKVLQDIGDEEFLLKLDNAQINTTIKLSKKNIEKINFSNKAISPTQLEVYFKCQFSYFCKYILKLNKPEKALFEVNDKGKLIHYVLENFFASYIDEDEILISDEQLFDIVSGYFSEYIEDQVEAFDKDSKRSLYIFEQYKSLTIMFIKYLCQEINKSEFKIRYCELKIDNKSDFKYSLKLPNNKEINFKGTIDRVDILEQNERCYIKVLDYKTGSKKFNMNDTLEGQNLQLLMYLFALLNTKKLNVNGKTVLPAGVLYVPVVIDSDKKNNKLNFSKRSGVILNDEIVADNLKTTSEYDFTPKGLLLDEKDFNNLQNIIYKKIELMFENIENGCYKINPLDASKTEACKYCDYLLICKNEQNKLNKKIKDKKDKELKEIISDWEAE